jgi:hypothetical protein
MTTIRDESSTTESDSNQGRNNERSTTPNQSKETTAKEQTTPKIKFPPTIENIPKQTTYQLLSVKAIGIIFIIGGILVISHIIGGTQKLGIILALVGVIFTFFISIKKPLINDKDLYIALALSIWIIASYFITFQADSEVFFILILLGFLIITELSQEYITKNFQKRLNILLFFFLMVFLLIIAEKIAIILRS